MKSSLCLLAVLLLAFVYCATCIQVLPPSELVDPLPLNHGAKPQVFTRDITFPYSGGAPFCSQCGALGAFACSNQPSWKSAQTFVDSTHYSGYSVLQIEVILQGSYGCTSPVPATVVGVMLNGVDIDILNVNGGKQCKCNTCDGTISFVKATPLGFPGYNLDGRTANNVSVNVYTGSICLNTLTVRVTYGKPTYPLKTKVLRVPARASRNIGEGLCGMTTYDFQSGTISFTDPLPANSVLYSMDVVLFGTYFFRITNSGCYNASAYLNLNGFPIGDTQSLPYPRSANSSDIVTSPCRLYGCDGQWLFSMAQLYQNGVPNYVYGSTNTLNWNNNAPPTLTLAFVDFWLYYYPAN